MIEWRRRGTGYVCEVEARDVRFELIVRPASPRREDWYANVNAYADGGVARDGFATREEAQAWCERAVEALAELLEVRT